MTTWETGYFQEEMFGASVCACVCVLLALSSGQLSEDDHQVIVEQHNFRRGQVEPAAVYMKRMIWDENLKIVAEGYAAKCRWDHNPDLEDLGENLYVTNGPLDPAEAITKWFKELDFYNYTSNECEEGQMCGHYTQVVWADSYKVGCAAHLCEEIEGLSFGKATILVCNYYPTGNFEGEKPYEEGESCSRCPDDMPHCEDLVCWPEVPEQQPSEEPDLTESWATDSPSAPPDLPGTTAPLPSHVTPAVESTPLEENLPSPSSAGEGGEGQAEAGPEGTPAGEEGAGGLPRLEEVSVDLGRSLDQALMDIDVFLDTQTSSSHLPKEEKVEEEGLEVDRKGRILVKVHDRNAATSGMGWRVWSGVLLLIGLLACVTV